MKKFSHTVALSLFAGIFISNSTYGMFSSKASKAGQILSSVGGVVISTILADYARNSDKLPDRERLQVSFEHKEDLTKINLEWHRYHVAFTFTHSPGSDNSDDKIDLPT